MKAPLKILTIIISLISPIASYSHDTNIEKNTLEQQINEQNKAMKAFSFAMKQETITAMQDFMSLYPSSPFVETAK